MNLKVVTWNIERGYQPEKIVNYLRSFDADIYCIQEIDRFVKRTKSKDILKILEDGLGMKSEYTKEFTEIDSWQRLVARPIFGKGGGGEQGNAIFTRYKIIDHNSVDLPLPASALDSHIELSFGFKVPFLGRRSAQIATIQIGATQLQIVNAHLDAWNALPNERLEQLDIILKQLDPSLPAVICGDLNTLGVFNWREIFFGNSYLTEILEFRKHFAKYNLIDPFSDKDATHRFLTRNHKLDWIAVSKNLQIKKHEMLINNISDHECLLVEIEI